MPYENMGYTTMCLETKEVLKVSIPKETYKEREINELHGLIKKQVGDAYLVVVVPNDVQLEIIV